MKKLLLFLLAWTAMSLGHAQTIAVTMPNLTNRNIGSQFNVAVQTATNILTTSNVKSYQFSIALPNNCTFVSIVHQAGDLGFNWGTPPTFSIANGILTIASAGTTNITGSGVFFRIRLQAASPGTAPISFTPTAACFFNQGSPARTLTNGSVQVNTPPSISVGPGSALLVRGETVVCSASGGTAPYTYTASAPSVGSFTGATFTALTQGTTQVRATDANGFVGATGTYDVRTYEVAVGSDQGNALHAFSVPITIGNPASVGFTAGEFQLSFDNSAFDLTGITTTGFALANTSVVSNVVGNTLYFSFGSNTMINPTSGATLCQLNFVKDPSWAAGANTGLGMVSVLFNETLNARTTDGSLTLYAPAAIDLSPFNATLRAGTQQQFTVNGSSTPPITWGVSDPSVASINSSGLLTALNDGATLVTVTDAAGNSATTGAITVYDADLTIASASVLAGTIVHVPIVLGPSVNNEPVLSAQLHIGYDAAALGFVGIEQNATLSQGWSSSYSTPGGQLILSLAGTNAGIPGGVLVFLKFQTLPPFTPGSGTGLYWISGLINEGDPAVQTINGAVFATDDNCGSSGCMNPYACNYDASALCDNGSCIFNPALCAVRVSPKVFLDGPYVNGAGLMNDALRALPTFPLTEPYTGIGYPHVGGGGETTTAGVLAVAGNNAIVDWVVVELRNATSPSVVVATRSALLQRDGDVVSSTDGVSPISFAVAAGNYYLAVRHRNHLGTMTAMTFALSGTPIPVNLTTATTSTYGLSARKSVSGTFPAEVLWSGDVNFDGTIIYTGQDNDRDPILGAIGGVVPTNTITGYHRGDVNMDGTVKYTGEDNDRDRILQNIGGVVPTNVRVEQMP